MKPVPGLPSLIAKKDQFGRYSLLRRSPERLSLLIAWLFAGPLNPIALFPACLLGAAFRSWLLLVIISAFPAICASIAVFMLRRQRVIMMADLQLLGLLLPIPAIALTALLICFIPSWGPAAAFFFVPVAFFFGIPAGLWGAAIVRFVAFRSSEKDLSPAPPATP